MYQETAYNTEKLEKQKEGEAFGYWTKKLSAGRKFNHTKADETVSISAIRDYLPTDKVIVSSEVVDRDGNKKNKEMFWNEKELLKESLSPLSNIYYLIVTLAKGFFYILFPFFSVLLIFLLLNASEGNKEKVFYEILPAFKYFILPCALIYGHFLLSEKKGFHWLIPPFIKGGRLYSLSRQTGMVTLYKSGNKVRFSHPFAEFDCYSISVPTPQGHLNTSLVLVHRYNNYKVGIPLSTLLGKDQSMMEYQNLWNMIQRYMDVSQPLPDCIILEESRERDPVTAAHDKVTGRNPRYWRDMTDDEYIEALDKVNEKQSVSLDSDNVIDIINGKLIQY